MALPLTDIHRCAVCNYHWLKCTPEDAIESYSLLNSCSWPRMEGNPLLTGYGPVITSDKIYQFSCESCGLVLPAKNSVQLIAYLVQAVSERGTVQQCKAVLENLFCLPAEEIPTVSHFAWRTWRKAVKDYLARADEQD